MNALVAMASREVRLRPSVLLLAFVVGWVPVALSHYAPRVLSFPGADPYRGIEPAAFALVTGVSMLMIAGLSLGWSAIAGEASSGRLGFFYARPVTWWALWAGKLAAAVVLSTAAGLLAMLPSLAVDFGQWRALLRASNTSFPLLGFGLQALLMVAVANAASVAYRGQPVRRALDMALSAALLFVLLRPSRILTVGAWSLGIETPYAVLLVPMGLALVAGSAMQVRAGRMEPRRSHALLSLTVWCLAFSSVGALAAIGSVMWWALPSHLRRVTRVEAPPHGGWIFVAGPVRWGQYSAAFFYEPASGQHISLGSAREMGRVSFAPDGSVAVVSEIDMVDPSTRSTPRRTRVVWLEGERRGLEKVFEFLPEEVSVSPRGEYLIAFRKRADYRPPDRLDFYKLPSGTLANSLALSAFGVAAGDANWPVAFGSPIIFQDDGRLRVYVRRAGGNVDIVTADIPTFLAAGKAHGPILEPSGGFRGEWWLTSATGNRVLLGSSCEQHCRRGWKGDESRPGDHPTGCVHLHDGVSGEHLSTLFEGNVSDAEFLADGRIAMVATEDGQAFLYLLNPETRDVMRQSRISAENVALAGELDSGDLLLGVRRNATEFGATARIAMGEPWGHDTLLEEGAYPALLKIGAGERPAPGSLGSELLITEKGGLVRYDSNTKSRALLLGGR